MKRWLLMVLLLLAGGAIVNVAVAWGWVVWHPVADSVALKTWQWPRVDSTGWQMYSLPHWPQAKVVTRHDLGAVDGEAPGAALVALSHDPFSDDFAADSFTIMSVCWQDYGWPRLSLRATEWQETVGARASPVVVRREYVPIERNFGQTRGIGWLPLRPRWPGFAINTVFYAAILWLLFAAPFALRRRRRIKRGLCPKCAYDLRNRAIDSSACPECGGAVARVSR